MPSSVADRPVRPSLSVAVAHAAGILIAWIIIGVMMINVTQALGELSIIFPVSGGFFTLAHRMLDPSFAFAVRWPLEKFPLTSPDGLGSSATPWGLC